MELETTNKLISIVVSDKKVGSNPRRKASLERYRLVVKKKAEAEFWEFVLLKKKLVFGEIKLVAEL